MNLLYVSTLCSENEFTEIYKSAKIKLSQQMQKYNILLAKGFQKSHEVKIEALSSRPITKSTHSKFFWKGKTETEDNITYRYLPFINYPIMRTLFVGLGSFITTFKWCFRNRRNEGAVLCDVLNMGVSYTALVAGKIMRKPVIGIVTDVPGYFPIDEANRSLKRKILNAISIKIIQSCDMYVFLTQAMNNVVNHKNKPYCIIEGQVDANMAHTANDLNNKYNQKVCLYAGTVNISNGIDILVQAYIKAEVPNSELHIYGSGELVKNLLELQKTNNNIKIYGSVLNNIVVARELNASLLVNPRPTHREFAKYSFPSKNMEYMVSGTPVLTTKIPGMSKEYHDYVYLIEEESVEGLKNALKINLSKSREELHKKGLEARKYVLEKKNNIVQAKKILDMINFNKNSRNGGNDIFFC